MCGKHEVQEIFGKAQFVAGTNNITAHIISTFSKICKMEEYWTLLTILIWNCSWVPRKCWSKNVSASSFLTRLCITKCNAKLNMFRTTVFIGPYTVPAKTKNGMNELRNPLTYIKQNRNSFFFIKLHRKAQHKEIYFLVQHRGKLQNFSFV